MWLVWVVIIWIVDRDVVARWGWNRWIVGWVVVVARVPHWHEMLRVTEGGKTSLTNTPRPSNHATSAL